jgi:holo-[acyl-carrier protein] synthase
MNRGLTSGIDIVEVHRFRELSPSIRDRFFQRVFTVKERAVVGDYLERAAGFFAAKEAVSKALGCGIGPISWQEIEINKDDQGKPEINLFGNALVLSMQAGIAEWDLSISHTKDNAVAMVIGIIEK